MRGHRRTEAGGVCDWSTKCHLLRCVPCIARTSTGPTTKKQTSLPREYSCRARLACSIQKCCVAPLSPWPRCSSIDFANRADDRKHGWRSQLKNIWAREKEEIGRAHV